MMSEQDPWLAEEAYMNLHRCILGESEPAFEEPELLEKVWGCRVVPGTMWEGSLWCWSAGREKSGSQC